MPVNLPGLSSDGMQVNLSLLSNLGMSVNMSGLSSLGLRVKNCQDYVSFTVSDVEHLR